MLENSKMNKNIWAYKKKATNGPLVRHLVFMTFKTILQSGYNFMS